MDEDVDGRRTREVANSGGGRATRTGRSEGPHLRERDGSPDGLAQDVRCADQQHRSVPGQHSVRVARAVQAVVERRVCGAGMGQVDHRVRAVLDRTACQTMVSGCRPLGSRAVAVGVKARRSQVDGRAHRTCIDVWPRRMSTTTAARDRQDPRAPSHEGLLKVAARRTFRTIGDAAASSVRSPRLATPTSRGSWPHERSPSSG